MLAMTQPAPSTTTPVSHGRSLALVVAVCVVGLGLAVAAGWLIGGQELAMAAGAGMLAAAVGGLAAWAVVALTATPNSPVMAAPMLGLMVRLVVTGMGVALFVMGMGLDRRPVLFAALFGYITLMAMETILLYRFASCDRPNARSAPAESVSLD